MLFSFQFSSLLSHSYRKHHSLFSHLLLPSDERRREREREREDSKGQKDDLKLVDDSIRSSHSFTFTLSLVCVCVCVCSAQGPLSFPDPSLARLPTVTGNHSLPGTFVCSVRGRDWTADCSMQQTVIFECISRSLFSLSPLLFPSLLALQRRESALEEGTKRATRQQVNSVWEYILHCSIHHTTASDAVRMIMSERE